MNANKSPADMTIAETIMDCCEDEGYHIIWSEVTHHKVIEAKFGDSQVEYIFTDGSALIRNWVYKTWRIAE